MKKVVALVSAVVLAAVVMCNAADEAKAKEDVVTGKVAIVKAEGKVTSIKIGEQAVKVDADSEKLLGALDGKEVTAKGTIGADKVLTVKSAEEKKAEAAK